MDLSAPPDIMHCTAPGRQLRLHPTTKQQFRLADRVQGVTSACQRAEPVPNSAALGSLPQAWPESGVKRVLKLELPRT